MIHVDQLCKNYHSFSAIQNISFSIEKGEIVGLLGANGAGKTTTMRILAGAIAPSSGSVSLLGKNIQHNPSQKQHIGYLPEVAPLYPQMKVWDYLLFVAQLKKLAAPTTAVDNIIQKLQLNDVKNTFIDQLSKGFRQRVGLAQALIHSPSFLILDEPTSGLDPKQRAELRTILQRLSKSGHTVLISSHILSEIEYIADRILIIQQGKLIAEHRLDINQQLYTIELARPCAEWKKQISALEDVFIKSEKDNSFLISASKEHRESIANLSVTYGLLSFAPHQSLEELYLDSVKR